MNSLENLKEKNNEISNSEQILTSLDQAQEDLNKAKSSQNIQEENIQNKNSKKPILDITTADLDKREYERFRKFFQSPQLNQNWGDLMGLSLKSLKNYQTLQERELKPFVIGICGGTSAGKTQMVKMMIKQLNTKKMLEKVSYLSEENFYKNTGNKNNKSNYDYDHPNNVDWGIFHEALDSLIERKAYPVPLFNMDEEERKEERKILMPTDLIIVEGMLVFYDEGIRSKCDLKIFLDTDEDVRLSRRVYKDVVLRAKKVEEVISRYLNFIKQDFERFVLPSKKYADIIIPNYGGGFSNESSEDLDHDEVGFNHFDHAAVDLIIDQVYKKVKKIRDIRDLNNFFINKE